MFAMAEMTIMKVRYTTITFNTDSVHRGKSTAMETVSPFANKDTSIAVMFASIFERIQSIVGDVIFPARRNISAPAANA
jgi:hypothetical protein